jgi:hypothetical protein
MRLVTNWRSILAFGTSLSKIVLVEQFTPQQSKIVNQKSAIIRALDFGACGITSLG